MTPAEFTSLGGRAADEAVAAALAATGVVGGE